ncbi:MAG: hypothetical protein AAF267_01630 [Deinococcota bacterium]
MKKIFTLLILAVLGISYAQTCDDGFRPFEHLGGTTCIPETPQRIVSLRDQNITLPLLEFGAPVVGSHGRLGDDGEPFMRSVDLHTGVNFENSDIVFIGDAIDFEVIASLNPDLIIGREWEMEASAQYEAIAPTVFIPDDAQEPLNFSRDVADAAGKLAAWDRLKVAYDANIARVREGIPELEGTTYTKFRTTSTGLFFVCAGFGGLTQVLGDLGFERIPYAQEMAGRGVAWCESTSVEIMPELEADYIFDTYGLDDGENVFSQREKLENLIPSGCDVLTACTEGRYIAFPIEVASEMSFSQLNTIIFLIESHIGRDVAPTN